MKTTHFLVAGALTFATFCSSFAEDLKPIFDGKGLSGWEVPEGNIWFSVEDGGVLKVKNGPKQKGATLWTEKEYEDFAMAFDCL